MIIAVITLVISFLLDGFMSTVTSFTVNNPSIWSTVYLLVALVCIYPYFGSDSKFLIIALICGLLFDFTYSNTLIFNGVIFTLMGLTIILINRVLSHHLFSIVCISLLIVTIFHSLTYLILNIINYGNYPLFVLTNYLVNSIIMTIIYTVIIYFSLDKLFKKFNLKVIK